MSVPVRPPTLKDQRHLSAHRIRPQRTGLRNAPLGNEYGDITDTFDLIVKGTDHDFQHRANTYVLTVPPSDDVIPRPVLGDRAECFIVDTEDERKVIDYQEWTYTTDGDGVELWMRDGVSASVDATRVMMGGAAFTAQNPQGILNGQVIDSSENIYRLLYRILRPNVNPSLTLNGGTLNHEIGSIIQPVITPTFNAGDAGAITEYRLSEVGGGVIFTSPTAVPHTVSTAFALLSDVSYNAQADHGSAALPAGTVTSPTITYRAQRRAFFGAPADPTIPTTSAEIRALAQSMLNPAAGTVLSVNVTAGAGRVIVFAYPATLPAPTSIIDGGVNVVDGYTKTTVNVEGFGGASPVAYRLIYLTNAIVAPSNRTITLTI